MTVESLRSHAPYMPGNIRCMQFTAESAASSLLARRVDVQLLCQSRSCNWCSSGNGSFRGRSRASQPQFRISPFDSATIQAPRPRQLRRSQPRINQDGPSVPCLQRRTTPRQCQHRHAQLSRKKTAQRASREPEGVRAPRDGAVLLQPASQGDS